MLDFLLHFDKHLLEFVRDYGAWVYAILFAIVFAETGFVVTPFLPGDSLLFAAGALCATGQLSAPAMLGLLVFAAVAGNTVDGQGVGPPAGTARHREPLQAEIQPAGHLLAGPVTVEAVRLQDRAHVFFEQYGGKAVILGRFVPIVRTFVPFVAGAAQMTTASFAIYNLAGAGAWVSLCLGAGWFFGNIPIIKNNFSLVTIGIVFVSILPMIFEMIAHRTRRSG